MCNVNQVTVIPWALTQGCIQMYPEENSLFSFTDGAIRLVYIGGRGRLRGGVGGATGAGDPSQQTFA